MAEGHITFVLEITVFKLKDRAFLPFGSVAGEMTIKDLSGRRYGRLTCIEPTGERGADGCILWRCRCDCGGECLASAAQLNRGDRKSCGCLRQTRRKALEGQRFGLLVVLSYEGHQGGVHHWRCQCDCGRQTVVSQSNLLSGHTNSCGCLQRESYRNNLKLINGTSITMIESRMKAPIRSNTSGYSGVYRDKRRGKWCAQITFKGKTYYLGSFSDIQDAVGARQRGEEALYSGFLDWYYGKLDSPSLPASRASAVESYGH